jgi:hypothetical protein
MLKRLVVSDAPLGRMAPPIIGRLDQMGSTGRDTCMLVEGVWWIVQTGALSRAWSQVLAFYAFQVDIRRILHTTNAIEALNARLRRAVRAREHFPIDEAALKLLFLILHRTEKEWTMPVREWFMAKAQFGVLFGERSTRAMA